MEADFGLRTDIAVGSLGNAISMSRTYDAGGHLLKTTQHVGGSAGRDVIAQYRYDAMGKVIAVIDSYGNTISATYDDLGRKVKLDDPDKGTSSYTWGGLGRLRSETDAKLSLSTFVYDDSGRKLYRYLNGSQVPSASWTYNNPTGTLTIESGDDGYFRQRGEGSGRPMHHTKTKTQGPHFHPTDRTGEKIPGNHHNYPGR
jgi:YD repeat-containing protein